MHEKHRDRLRKRYINEGLNGFHEHEVLELLLFYSIPRKDTNATAHLLIKEFGSLANTFDANIEDLIKVDGIGYNSAIFIKLFVDIMRRYRTDKIKKGTQLLNSYTASEFACELMFSVKNEEVWVICLNMKSEIIAKERVCEGTLTESPIYPRKIVSVALKHNSAKIIIVHNHPGGSVRPSTDDLLGTSTIIKLLKGLDIDLVDHIITSDNIVYSFSASKKMDLNENMDKETAYACQYEDGFLDEGKSKDIVFKQVPRKKKIDLLQAYSPK